MIPSREKTLVVFALEQEAKDCFPDFELSFCGVGKVNAAHHLTRRIAGWEANHGGKPSLILNLGSAGSGHFTKGLIVNCTHFVQRDFDTTALGTAPFTTPFEDHHPAILNHGLRFDAHPEGTCGTGDSFETAQTQGPWNVVDMEAYALAKVSLFESIPFACLKYISDGADGHAAGTWEDSLNVTAHRLREAIDRVF